MKLKTISPGSVVSGAVIAELLKISARRVEQLAAQGVIQREGRGRYKVENAVAGYVEFLREPGYRRMLAEQARDLGLSDLNL